MPAGQGAGVPHGPSGTTQPWRCLCRTFLQMTRTIPARFTTRQCSHIRLTDALTFMDHPN